jgi:surfeit locus 1 family protein
MTKLTTPRWMISHLFILVALIILINFGRWQLGRLEQRRTHNANVLTALNQPTTHLDGSPVDPAEFHFRHVSITGQFDNQAGVFLRNQQSDGASGFDLIVPLQITGSDTAVLVNRGWIPRGNVDPSPESLRVYDLEGEVTVEGIAYPSETRPNSFAPSDPELKPGQTRLFGWFWIDINRIQEQLPYPLLDIYVEQLPPENVDPTTLPRRANVVVLDEGPHLSYAMQWFSFATILIVTYILFIRQELREQS